MGKFIFKICAILVFYAIIVCCNSKSPLDKKLNNETFIKIYCDVVFKYDMIEAAKRNAFLDSIFTHYNVSQEMFMNTTLSYNKNPKKWKKIFEGIIANLEERNKKTETDNSPVQQSNN